MRLLVLGGDGFVGSAVATNLEADHEVLRGVNIRPAPAENYATVDLLNPVELTSTLAALRPEVIVNCAGVVENSDKARLNVQFTQNLMKAVLAAGIDIKRIIISGSAAEYGKVSPDQLPVNEGVPLNPFTQYGESKAEEERTALSYGEQHGLPVVVVRIFNPIGASMHERFLISSLIRQVKAYKQGDRHDIEVSRLDAERDYIDVRDIARAVGCIVAGRPQHKVYNIGSGIATSNERLVSLILQESGMGSDVPIRETSSSPEPLVATQADCNKLRNEFGWTPHNSLEQVIREVING